MTPGMVHLYGSPRPAVRVCEMGRFPRRYSCVTLTSRRYQYRVVLSTVGDSRVCSFVGRRGRRYHTYSYIRAGRNP